MRVLNKLTAAAAILALTTPAFAGGLSDQIMEAPVAVEEEMAPAGSSIDPSLIVLGILGLLLLGAGSGDGEEIRNEKCELGCSDGMESIQ